MGLYLCIFDGEEELDGVEIGQYSDFNYFRTTIATQLENDLWGSRFPTLMLHSDCDGTWSPDEAKILADELRIISGEFQHLPAIDWPGDWQKEVAKFFGLTNPKSLSDCFIDVDGEPLIDRLIGLAELSYRVNEDILFQ